MFRPVVETGDDPTEPVACWLNATGVQKLPGVEDVPFVSRQTVIEVIPHILLLIIHVIQKKRFR
jgi:hypothetical protein